MYQCFLVASTRLYNPLCPSVGRLVGHTSLFLSFFFFDLTAPAQMVWWPQIIIQYTGLPISSVPLPSAHPHATWVAEYSACLSTFFLFAYMAYLSSFLSFCPPFSIWFSHSFFLSHLHNWFMDLFAHSLICSYIHSFIYSMVYKFIHSFMYEFIHSCMNSFIFSFIDSCYCFSFIHSPIHTLSSLDTPINSFIHPFIHPLIH